MSTTIQIVDYYKAIRRTDEHGRNISSITTERITRCIDCKAYGVCEIGLPPDGFCSNAEPKDKDNV